MKRGGRGGWRRAGPTWLLAVLASAMAAALAAGSASAHADLIGSEPAAGSTVAGSPGTIRLSFSQPLQGGSTIQLFSGQFVPVTGLAISVAGSELQAVVGQPLPAGTYTVQWTAVTDDGHTTEGSYQFGVAAAGSEGPGRLAPLLAGMLVLIGGGVAAAAWLVNRRRRV
jgi:methionine-rich copper-binding protein CopC